MRDTNNELDSLRTGPASWSSLKIFGLLWAVVFSALLLNAVLMSGAAQLWGHDNFPSGMLSKTSIFRSRAAKGRVMPSSNTCCGVRMSALGSSWW